MSRAIVLLAHGSRDQRWRQPFEALRNAIAWPKARTGAGEPDREPGGPGRIRVELAYLQLSEPTLDQALRRCRIAGAKHVLVVPLFLSGGGHLLRDVPDAVGQAGQRAGIQTQIADAIGEQPEVMQAMAEAIYRLAAI